MIRSIIQCVPFDSRVCYHSCDTFIVWFYNYKLVNFAVGISCPHFVELFAAFVKGLCNFPAWLTALLSLIKSEMRPSHPSQIFILAILMNVILGKDLCLSLCSLLPSNSSSSCISPPSAGVLIFDHCELLGCAFWKGMKRRQVAPPCTTGSGGSCFPVFNVS